MTCLVVGDIDLFHHDCRVLLSRNVKVLTPGERRKEQSPSRVTCLPKIFDQDKSLGRQSNWAKVLDAPPRGRL